MDIFDYEPLLSLHTLIIRAIAERSLLYRFVSIISINPPPPPPPRHPPRPPPRPETQTQKEKKN